MKFNRSATMKQIWAKSGSHGLSSPVVSGVRKYLYRAYLNAKKQCELMPDQVMHQDWINNPTKFIDDILEYRGNPEESGMTKYRLYRSDKTKGWNINNVFWQKQQETKK